MKTQKILFGTIVSAVVMFFLGWLIFGILVGDFMGANCDTRISRPMEEFVWWSMIFSNLMWALLLCIAIGWRGEYSAVSGLKVGAVLGFVAALGTDFSMYAMTTYFGNPTIIFVDAIGMAIMLGISGAVAAMVMARVGKNNVSN